MNQELRDIMLYYYKHRDIIEPQNKQTHTRKIDNKNGLWIKKDKNVLAILSPHRIEWNGRPITSHDPNAFAVFHEFIKSVHLRHQDELVPITEVVVERQEQTRKEDEISRPEQYFDVMEQRIPIAIQQDDDTYDQLWNNLFTKSIKRKEPLTFTEKEHFSKIFQEMSKSREQMEIFMKHVSHWMRKDPVATKRFLKKILPVGHFTRSVHKHRNWLPDYLRYWMSSISTKEFERQLSEYVKELSTPGVKSFKDVSSILDKLNKKIYEQRDTTETMENFFINLYKLIEPITDHAHYKYASEMIHEEMIRDLRRATSSYDCKEYVIDAMECLRRGKYMTKRDFIRLYQVLLVMNECKDIQQTLFSIAKLLLTQQLREKCKEKHVPMVPTKDIFQILERFEMPYKTLVKLTPYYYQIRKIFKILGWTNP